MTFEERFFGPGNVLRWETIRRGALAAATQERLGPFLDDLSRDLDVLVLPRVLETERVQWYVLCHSARAARIARDEFRAFLGPSYSDFDGHPTLFDPSDPIDAAVLERCGRHAFRIEIPDKNLFTAARERLRLLMSLRQERPARRARYPRAVGRILRDFEYALQVRDGSAASICIDELRATGKLDAANLLFLETRRLGALEDWHALLAKPELWTLLGMTRPRRVTEVLVRAVYASYLENFELEGRPAEAVQNFRSEVLPQFADLYRTRAGLAPEYVDSSFMLLAVASVPPRHELVQTILADHPMGTSRRTYLEAIAALVPASAVISPLRPLDQARQAFAVADIDRAYELVLPLPASFERCALLLRCARDMGTLEAARTALSAVTELSTEDRERLHSNAILARIAASIDELTGGSTALPDCELPSSWATWLARIEAPDRWTGAVNVAETGAREWKLAQLLADPDQLSEVADRILADRPEWGQAVLRDALPYLLEFFLPGHPDSRLKSIYENLFVALAVDDQVSLAQLRALVLLAEARLTIGVSSAEYGQVVTQLGLALEAVASPSASDLALETVDMLVNVPCPAPEIRQQFLANVSRILVRWRRRLDPAQWALLRVLGDELGMPGMLPVPSPDTAPPEQPGWSTLVGKKIALYSLNESALRRAREVIHQLCPSAEVQLFCDHVGGSHALRTAAATADIFVVATASAKHAATSYIEARRPKERPLTYARGGGASSLLAVLRDRLTETAGVSPRS